MLTNTLKQANLPQLQTLFQDFTAFSPEAKALAKTGKAAVATAEQQSTRTTSATVPETVTESIRQNAFKAPALPPTASSQALIPLETTQEANTTSAAYPVVQTVKDWVSQGVNTLRSYFSDRFTFGFWKKPALSEDLPPPLRIRKKPVEPPRKQANPSIPPAPLSKAEQEQQAFWRSMFSPEELRAGGGSYQESVMEDLNARIDTMLQGKESLIEDCLFEQQGAELKPPLKSVVSDSLPTQT